MITYRKIDTSIWTQQELVGEERLPPSVKSLLLFLLTGPHTTAIPGLYSVGRAALAECLQWELEEFMVCWNRLAELGLAQADWTLRVIWVPQALVAEAPVNPNAVRSWDRAWAAVPACALKNRARVALRSSLEGRGAEFLKAFDEACPDPSAKASSMPPGNVPPNVPPKVPPKVPPNNPPNVSTHDQDQDQNHTHIARARDGAGVCVSAPPPSQGLQVPAPFARRRPAGQAVVVPTGEVMRVWKSAEALLGTGRGVRLLCTEERAELVDGALAYATPDELCDALLGFAGCPYWKDKHLTLERCLGTREHVEEGLRRRKQNDWQDPRPRPVVVSSSPLPDAPTGPRKSLAELGVQAPWSTK